MCSLSNSYTKTNCYSPPTNTDGTFLFDKSTNGEKWGKFEKIKRAIAKLKLVMDQRQASNKDK